MSRLSVFWPDEVCSDTAIVPNEPRIIPFPSRASRSQPEPNESHPKLDAISRARLLFSNRLCRHCHNPLVEPLHLNDALVNRQGLEIPGTATIIGFRCRSCDAEWSS